MRKVGEMEAEECERTKKSLEKQAMEINEIIVELEEREMKIQQKELEV